MAKSLEERFEGLMKAGARWIDIKATIAEVEGLISECEKSREKVQADALDINVSEADARAAREMAGNLALSIERLEARRDRLKDRLSEVIESDRARKLRREYAEAAESNAALQKELRERVPMLFDELVSLLQRIKADEQLVRRVNDSRPGNVPPLRPAEVVARGYDPVAWGYGTNFQSLCTIVRLPNFGRSGLMWPASNGGAPVAVAPSMAGRRFGSVDLEAARERAASFKRYRLVQPRNTGVPTDGIEHRDGVCWVHHKPVERWMDDVQVQRARDRGLLVELAPEAGLAGTAA